VRNILPKLKDKRFFQKLREFNLQMTREKIKASVSEDNLITQSISTIRDLEKSINLLEKRLREWYGLYNPEFTMEMGHLKFTEIILNKSKEQLLSEIHREDSMGADLAKEDLEAVMEFAKSLLQLQKQKADTEQYLERLMKRHCPNINELAGTTIAAELLSHLGSLRKFAITPASTIQILGAEKALFRHLKTGARPPKYGILFSHPFVQEGKRPDQGKRARALADKLAIAARIDFFKGEFLADKLKKQLEGKFS